MEHEWTWQSVGQTDISINRAVKLTSLKQKLLRVSQVLGLIFLCLSPLRRSRRRPSGPGGPGPGYWPYPAAQWPESDWEAERWAGAERNKTQSCENNQSPHFKCQIIHWWFTHLNSQSTLSTSVNMKKHNTCYCSYICYSCPGISI